MQAPAKVNFYLEVTGVRPDGYHELRTVFLPLRGLSDEVSLAEGEAPGVALECAGDPSVPRDGRNLCVRAALAFAAHFRLEPRWRIRLTKRIPTAAGLGGGSSNAAAVLRLLAELHHLEGHPDLPAIAARLGADVPFFLQGRPAAATGIGDRLAPLPRLREPLELLLVNPGFPLPVRWVYDHLRRPDPPPVSGFAELVRIWGTAGTEELLPYLRNDLEACVFAKFPILPMLRRRLLERGAAGVLLSGSGPTLFAVCRGNLPELSEDIRRTFGAGMKLFGCSA